jgi:two-component system, OmpR family, alkaline phosphatase synthesis response regulator PhoP
MLAAAPCFALARARRRQPTQARWPIAYSAAMHTHALRSPQTQPDHAGATDIAGCRILLVDDNEQNLELLLAYLDELGCELRTAIDGPEALDDVAKAAPDLILLDIMMPKMSGFQVCKKLKGSDATANIPILMVTALNEVSDVERAVEAGADDFLTKPVNRVELVTRVKSLLKVSVLQRQLKKSMGELRKLQG